MHATIRRYDGVDQSRTRELTQKAKESLAPRLSELAGFNGYYLVDAGDGVVSSVSVFDTAEHADASNSVAADWVREEKFEQAMPNAPKVTSGEVVVNHTADAVTA